MSADSVASLVASLAGDRLGPEEQERHSLALGRGASAGGRAEVSTATLQALAKRAEQPSQLVRQYSACSGGAVPQVSRSLLFN